MTNNFQNPIYDLGDRHSVFTPDDLSSQHSNPSTNSDNSDPSQLNFQTQLTDPNESLPNQVTTLSLQLQQPQTTANGSDGVLTLNFNNELFTIFMQINPINAWTYYTKCQASQVNHHQLFLLTETMSGRMFEDDEIGLWAEFHSDLQKLKLSKQQNENGCSVGINPGLTPMNTQSSHQLDSQLASSSQKGSGNPNSLLKIISIDQVLYKKALEKNDPAKPKTLSSREENVLLSYIKNHFVLKCCNKMSYEEMESLAQEIQTYFPGEDESTYFKKEIRNYTEKKTGGSYERVKACGKIYSKWNNRREKNPLKPANVSSKDICYTMPIRITEVSGAEKQQALEAIRLNLASNLNYPITMILNEWNETRDCRFECIEKNKKEPGKVFMQWPRYELSDSHILVSIMII